MIIVIDDSYLGKTITMISKGSLVKLFDWYGNNINESFKEIYIVIDVDENIDPSRGRTIQLLGRAGILTKMLTDIAPIDVDNSDEHLYY